MNTLKKILIMLFLVTITFSCEDYLDINDDPNAPANVSLDLRLKPVILLTHGAAQWRGTRETSAVVQYVAGRQAALNADTWNITNRNFFWQNTLVWTYANAVDLIVMGEDQNSPHYTGVGKIFKAYLLVSLSDQYGKIPWDDLYDGRSQPVLQPRFVEQSVIYDGCIKLLDEAVDDLSSTNNSLGLNKRGGDLVYEGDTEKWIKFAYALKARYLNHYSKKSTLYDPVAIIAACNNAFANEAEDAECHYYADASTTQANPWSREGFGGFASATSPRYGSYSNFFISMLQASPLADDNIDPRLPIIMNPADSTGLYTGLVNGRGYDSTNVLGHYSQVPDGFYSSAGSPGQFITYSEVKFIEAEARLRNGDVPGSIAAFKEGVVANMRKLGVADTSITAAEVKIDALTTGDFSPLEAGLQYIMTQKYIVMVFHPETWVDLRRMDYSSTIYPGLVKPENVNSIFGPGEWIRALPYEYNEENRNATQLGDNRVEVRLKTPVWWDIAE